MQVLGLVVLVAVVLVVTKKHMNYLAIARVKESLIFQRLFY